MGLLHYRQKRDFKRTPEPAGRKRATKARGLVFVIQKHDASHLHYDFRLEMEGVLKSWAVPKGVPLEKGEKRLAMQVEDHPLDYGSFEGTIPEGNYGAGTVMLWDTGTYKALESDPLKGLEAGKLRIALSGKKLKGEWTLVRMRGREQGNKQAWLLIKSGENLALSAKTADRSVSSGRTLEEIADGRSRVWKSNRTASRNAVRTKMKVRAESAAAPQVQQEDMSKHFASAITRLPVEPARFVFPMKAVLVDSAPHGKDWVFEIKWDGYRALAVKVDGNVSLYSRNARDVTAEFPTIAKAAGAIPGSAFVMDGEIVALDEHGRPSFQLLQRRKKAGSSRTSHLYYYAFDLINVENHSALGVPLAERKSWLEDLLSNIGDPIRFSAAFENSKALLDHARKNEIEGIIGKKRNAKYDVGRRSRNWVKVKIVNEQEFLIGGYTEPKGGRAHFGAILVGYYKGDSLLFASKVGTGFDTDTLNDLYARFQKLKTENCPFASINARPASGGGLTPAERRRCTWLKPELVCQVRFAEWTADGGLRQPVFLGLRDDKNPGEVVDERPSSAPRE